MAFTVSAYEEEKMGK